MTSSSPARPKSRTAVAREVIRRRILRLEMPPGTVFSEGDLAAALDLGKTPVREALNLLTHESLVAVAPHSGYLVMPVTLRDVRELLELRVTVETLPARLAAARGEGTAGLDAAALAWWQATSGERTDAVPRPVQGLAYGAALAERAGNARAAEVEGYVLRHQLRHLYLATALGDPHWPAPDRSALSAALAAGDPDGAAAVVEDGIRALGAALFATLVPVVAAYLNRPADGGPGGLPPDAVLDLDLGTLLRDGDGDGADAVAVRPGRVITAQATAR
ncbi:GntR family transcriptional regulator [Embleya sp. MST-111070]|uniref:GntR family transcriptional regulator n=1 Tax=Embleya sp. MST-111070 TaxID=3398231 RepID=UPI003F736644